MKKMFVFALVGLALFYGCSKQEHPAEVQPSSSAAGISQTASFSGYRMRGTTEGSYSASISVDTANWMIGSYLASVNHPTKDTALRALSFSADSLRAYLSNPSITTIRFMLAHQPSYIKDGNYGVYAGMDPEAITVVIVGTTDEDKYVLNSSQGVFEHCSPCPVYCTGISSALIQ